MFLRPFYGENFTTPQHMAAQQTTWVSVAVNLVLTFAQVIFGVVTGSQGLVADGIHSASDLLSDGLVLWTNQHSQKAPDDDHPYGHYRFETAASLVLGLLLVIVGVSIIVPAVRALTVHSAVLSRNISTLALLIALATILIKEGLFRYMLKEAERVRSSLLIANAWHARSDAASSFVVALGILGSRAGYPLLDLIAALIVGLIVGRTGLGFAWTALQDLMDRAIEEDSLKQITESLLSTKGVLGIHDLRTRKVGDLIWVDVHLEVDGTISVEEGHDIGVAAKHSVMNVIPAVLNVMTHIDPVKVA